jgi:hypothetical protein
MRLPRSTLTPRDDRTQSLPYRRRIHIISPHFSRYNIKPSNYEQLVSDQGAAKLANICPNDLALQIPAKNISRAEFSTTNTVVGIKIRTYLITGQFDSLIYMLVRGLRESLRGTILPTAPVELAIS